MRLGLWKIRIQSNPTLTAIGSVYDAESCGFCGLICAKPRRMQLQTIWPLLRDLMMGRLHIQHILLDVEPDSPKNIVQHAPGGWDWWWECLGYPRKRPEQYLGLDIFLHPQLLFPYSETIWVRHFGLLLWQSLLELERGSILTPGRLTFRQWLKLIMTRQTAQKTAELRAKCDWRKECSGHAGCTGITGYIINLCILVERESQRRWDYHCHNSRPW